MFIEGYNQVYIEEYKGYALDVSRWDLTSNELIILDTCVYFVDNKYSIRKTASNLGISKSTVHRYLHRCRSLSYDLYGCVKKVIKEHIK